MTREQARQSIEQFQRVRTIGELTITLPEPPRWNTIPNHDLPPHKQFFPYTPQPEKNDEPSEEFLNQEFDRFSHGFWFFNNGKLEYISNIHYFFLNYWKDKSKVMRFNDAQRDTFLWWKAIEEDENMAGGNLVTCRRHGKTAMATCIGYFRTTTNKDHRCGIQSKTNKDGKVVFGKLIKSWRKLPEWLRPTHSGESRPATILEFFEPRKRNTKGVKAEYVDALDSSIDYQSSEEDAYDGEELNTVIEDETGKTVTTNTDTRWGVLQLCLMDGSEIVGKAIRTTTVEEMEKRGGKNMYLTWKGSEIKTRSEETGRTDTMLTNLFVPADFGFKGNHPVTKEPFIDEYGYSNRELVVKYLNATWKNLSDTKLKAAQRKNPLTVRHAFQLANDTSCFDVDLLQDQLDYLNDTPNLTRRVTFFRGNDGKVTFEHDQNGSCQMSWDFGNPTETNRKRMTNSGLWMPDNTESFAIGVDPIGATMTTGSEKSQAVAYVYRKGDINDPENSALMVLRYAPPRKSIRFKWQFHEYVMMLCEYYGCKANYESNIDDYYETFINNGFKNYVMWRPKSTIDPQRKNIKVKYGTPSNDPFSIQKQTDIADEYIKLHCHKIYFIELVKQLIKFDPEDRTHFDDCIAFFMALIGGSERKTDNTIKMSGMHILPLNSGSNGKMNPKYNRPTLEQILIRK